MGKLLIPVFLGLAFQSTSAFALGSASVQASIDWSAATINLIDLDLTDGLTPSLTWSDQYGDISVKAGSYGGLHYIDLGHISDGRHASSATSIENCSATTFAANSSAAFDNMALVVGAYANVSASPGYSWQENIGEASGSASTSFLLSGAGVMVISVPYSVAVTSDVGGGWAFGAASMGIDWSTSDGTDYSDTAGKSIHSSSQIDKSISGLFTMAVANLGGGVTTSGSVHTSLSASSNLYGSVAAVPEPSSYAMMVAGLVMVGSLVRRRLS